MKSTILAGALAALALACTIDPIPDPGPGPGPAPFDCDAALQLSGVVEVEDPVPDSYLVVLKPTAEGEVSTASATIQELSQYAGVGEVRIFERSLPGFACNASAAEAERMAGDPRVAFVQQVGKKSVSPLPPQQDGATWGLDRTDQRDLPLDGRFEPGDTGAGIHAYVIDTGVDVNHTEFIGRIGEGFSATGGGFLDDNGHGTHVAGTLGGTQFGVAKQVVIHPVKVLRNGFGTDADVIEGVEWVTGHVQDNGWPAVANMSLGGPVSPALDIAVCNSIAAGVSYAVAAGNENEDACESSPARIAQAIGTGASDRSDQRASFSNTGPCVDVFAPGLDITSARNGGGSTTLSGTSMASPHAAGVAALCTHRSPGARPAEVRQCVIDHASRDKLTGIGAGSPNRLVYARDDDAGSNLAGGGAAPVPGS